MENNEETEFIVANIPSEKPYYVSKRGEVKGVFGRVLERSVTNNTRTSRITYKGKDGKYHQVGFRRLVWNTLFPNDLAEETDMIFLRDHNIPFPLQPSNLEKVSKAQVAARIGKVNFLGKEREILFDALKKRKKMTRAEMYDLLQLKDREKGRVVLNNLITRLINKGTLEKVGHSTYALKKQK